PARPGVLRPGYRTLARGQKRQSLSAQLLLQVGTPVAAIAQGPAADSCEQLFSHPAVMHVSWTEGQADDDARPADAHVPPQPKEGALGDVVVVAPGRPLSQPARAVRSAHPA